MPYWTYVYVALRATQYDGTCGAVALLWFSTRKSGRHAAFGLGRRVRKLRPSAPGAATPPAAAKVGARSMFATSRELVAAVCATPSQRTTSGTRIDSS